MSLKVKTFVVGMFASNCYVLNSQATLEAVLIDPGFDEPAEAEAIFNFIEQNGLRPMLTVNTHGHPDHTCGNGMVKNRFHTPILIHSNDAHMIGELGKELAEFFGVKNYSPEADKLLKDGDILEFGNLKLRVLHTPGHSNGSISLVCEGEVFTGDTLFAGSIGRTDFPESSDCQMRISLQKLAQLQDRLTVYPGHGPATTIGREKVGNPFLQGL